MTYWEDLTLADREAHIRRPLAVLRKAWPAMLQAPAPGKSGVRRPPGSRPPIALDPLSVAHEIRRDLAFWVRALLEDHPGGITDGQTVHLSDVEAMIGHLLAEARWAAGWSRGWDLQSYLTELAHDASVIAWPRDSGTIYIGQCTNTIGVGGEAVACDTPVRVRAEHPGDVKCRGCGVTDTVDGWILRIVGDETLVTAEQLVPILHKRLGVVIAPSTVRKWKERGEIAALGVDSKGRDLFDRHHAYLVITRRQARDEAATRR